jgi:hypothetical protein
MILHEYLFTALKIRKNNASIRKRYTVDYFLICHHIHAQQSASILSQ